MPFEWYAAEPCDEWFLALARSMLCWKQVRGPCGVSMVALYLRAIFVTVESCLPASVFSIEVSMTQRSLLNRQTSPASR